MRGLIFILIIALLHMLITNTQDVYRSATIAVISFIAIQLLVSFFLYVGVKFILKHGTDAEVEALLKAFRDEE